MTDCNAVRELLAETGSEAVQVPPDIQSHVDSCPSCARLRDNLRLIEANLKALPPYAMPDALAADILQAVRANGQAPTSAAHVSEQRSRLARWFDSLVSATGLSMQLAWRQKWVVVGTVVVVSAFVTLSWPQTYRSKATILIEEKDIPGEFLQHTVDGWGNQRVQVISQQVLTSKNLMKLIGKFDLYPEVKDSTQLKAAATNLRDSISVDFVSAEPNAPRMAGRHQTTIAFTLGFSNEDPQTAQNVTEELVSLYLAENQRTPQANAAQTTEFLSQEADQLAQQVTELESKLAAFKREHKGSLPDEVSINQQTMYRYELQLLELRHRIQSQEERKVYIESQLTQVSPYASISSGDGTVLRPEERLKKLESEYSELSYTYGPKHPRMVGIETEIQDLESVIGKESQRGADKPSNPAYIQLQAHLKAVKSNLSSLQSRRDDIAAKYRILEDRMLKAPGIEREYLLLTRNYEKAVADYRVVQKKLSEAERLEALETEQKGEHFSVIEPPELSLAPVGPNLGLILGLAFVGSLVLGLILSIAIEKQKSSRRSRGAKYQYQALLAPFVIVLGSAMAAGVGGNIGIWAELFSRLDSVRNSGLKNSVVELAQMHCGRNSPAKDRHSELIPNTFEGCTRHENISVPQGGVFRRSDKPRFLPPHIAESEREYMRYLEATYGDVDRAMRKIGCEGQAPGAFNAVYRTGDFFRDGWCSSR